MRQPIGYVNAKKKGMVCKLVKSLYGLKQAPICWNNNINSLLINNGFKRMFGELGLYSEGNIYIGLYVDDLLIAGIDNHEITKVKELLMKSYEMKDLGLATKFLGMNVVQVKLGYI